MHGLYWYCDQHVYVCKLTEKLAYRVAMNHGLCYKCVLQHTQAMKTMENILQVPRGLHPVLCVPVHAASDHHTRRHAMATFVPNNEWGPRRGMCMLTWTAHSSA